MAEGEVAAEAEAAVRDVVEDTNASETLEKIQNDQTKAMLDNNTEVLKEINERKITLSKNVIKGLIDGSFKGDEAKSAKVNEIVKDAFEKMQKDPENGIKIWSEAEGKISVLDKSFGTKVIDILKYPFEKLYDGYSSLCDYFTSDEGKVKKLALEKSRAVLNDPNATADQKIEAQKEYTKTIKEISPELDKAEEKAKSIYGEALATLMKVLFIAGGFIGILAILANKLNGCYQYKIGKDKLKICDDFYSQKDNHQYCECGDPPTPLVCDNTTNNYPYCHCGEVKNQVCNFDATSKSQLYYSYDDSHSAWTLMADAVVGAYDFVKKLPSGLNDIWEWFKKYGWIALIVIILIIGLPFIIGAINTSKEIYHQIHPDGTTTTHTKEGESHFKPKRR